MLLRIMVDVFRRFVWVLVILQVVNTSQLLVVDRESDQILIVEHEDPPNWQNVKRDLAVTCLINEINAAKCDRIYEQFRIQNERPDTSNEDAHEIKEEVGTDGDSVTVVPQEYSEDPPRSCSMGASSSARPLVSIVIPSLGRITLERTLRSLDQQEDKDFEVILVLDGISAAALAVHESRPVLSPKVRPWLCVVELPERLGEGNSGGYVRNRGIPFAKGRFIGFLDDDDRLSTMYVSRLREEMELYPEAVAYVFRMTTGNPYVPVLPPPKASSLAHAEVGISFIVLRDVLLSASGAPDDPGAVSPILNLGFPSSPREDYDFIVAVARQGRVILSPFITYHVRRSDGGAISSSISGSLKRVLLDPAPESPSGSAQGQRAFRDTIVLALERSGGRPSGTAPRTVVEVPFVIYDLFGKHPRTEVLQVLEGEETILAVARFCERNSVDGPMCNGVLDRARLALLARGDDVLIGVANGRVYLNDSPDREIIGDTVSASHVTGFGMPHVILT